jgi:hypothetical protein
LFAAFQDDPVASSGTGAAEAALAEPKHSAPAAVVYTPARTPGRSKLGLSGTPARALRSQFDDAADAVTAVAAAEGSEAPVDAAALGSTIKLATVIVDNRMTATPVRRSARKVQGCEEDATLGDRKAVLSLLHATNFQFAPNPSLSNRRESVGMSVIVAAEDNGEAQQPADSHEDEPQDATEQDVADGAADDAAAFQDDPVASSGTGAAEAALAEPKHSAPAAVVYTPARTPGRSKLGLSGTPARLFVAATPGSDVFYSPASCFSPCTPFGSLDSPLQRSASKHFR